MASTILVVFFLCFVCMVISLPVVKDLQPTHIGLQSDSLSAIGSVLSSDGEKVLVRTKRQVIRGSGHGRCPRHKIYYKHRCMSFKRYESLILGDYDA